MKHKVIQVVFNKMFNKVMRTRQRKAKAKADQPSPDLKLPVMRNGIVDTRWAHHGIDRPKKLRKG